MKTIGSSTYALDTNIVKDLFKGRRDIADKIDSDYQNQGLSRRECCVKALNRALQTRSMPGSCYYVLPTMSTETWLLALHDHQDHPQVFALRLRDYEKYEDPESMLLEIGLPGGSGRLRKTVGLYADYAVGLIANITKVRSRCAEFDSLCREFERQQPD